METELEKVEKETDVKVLDINGVRFSVDMAHVKKIDDFKVGDKVKVLTKNYSDYVVHNGVIIGFEWFQSLPTISICYLKVTYGDCKIEFLNYNAQSKDVEITHSNNQELPINRADVLQTMDNEIEKKKLELEGLTRKKEYFLKQFQVYFRDFESKGIGE